MVIVARYNSGTYAYYELPFRVFIYSFTGCVDTAINYTPLSTQYFLIGRPLKNIPFTPFTSTCLPLQYSLSSAWIGTAPSFLTLKPTALSATSIDIYTTNLNHVGDYYVTLSAAHSASSNRYNGYTFKLSLYDLN